MATLAHDVCDVHGASVLNIYKNLLARFVQGFPYLEDRGVPPPTKNLLIHPLRTKFLFPPTESQFNLIKNKNIFFSCSHYTIFVLISYSFNTQIMLILILIDVQYSQFLNRQNHSSSDSHHLVKKFPQQCSLLFDTKSEKLLKF